jgi:hypothetical protein
MSMRLIGKDPRKKCKILKSKKRMRKCCRTMGTHTILSTQSGACVAKYMHFAAQAPLSIDSMVCVSIFLQHFLILLLDFSIFHFFMGPLPIGHIDMIHKIIRERSAQIQGTFSADSGNVQGTFSTHSWNVQHPFMERSLHPPAQCA